MVPTLFGLSIYSVQAVCNSCPKFGLAPQTRFTSKILCHLNFRDYPRNIDEVTVAASRT